MANPPPLRPWSRFSSLLSVPAPAPVSAPAVTAERFVGAAERGSAPSSHPQKKVPAPSASLPSSPSLKPSQPPTTSSSLENNGSATKSPQTTTPAVQTPMLKLTTPPPSPLPLTPSQLKVNPETVLVQETIEKPKQDISNHEKQVTAKENKTNGKGIHGKLLDSEGNGIRAITIAGENRGAYMEIIQSSKKPNYLHKKANSNIKVYDYELENSGSGEGNANRKDKSQKEKKTLFSPPTTAYVNSNVQCVNNSLLYHTSCTHHDPGVHLTLPKKPFGEGFHVKERVDGQHN